MIRVEIFPYLEPGLFFAVGRGRFFCFVFGKKVDQVQTCPTSLLLLLWLELLALLLLSSRWLGVVEMVIDFWSGGRNEDPVNDVVVVIIPKSWLWLLNDVFMLNWNRRLTVVVVVVKR